MGGGSLYRLIFLFMVQKGKIAKIVAVALSIILFLNLTLFVLNKINGKVCWPIIIIIALIAFKGMPYLKEK